MWYDWNHCSWRRFILILALKTTTTLLFFPFHYDAELYSSSVMTSTGVITVGSCDDLYKSCPLHLSSGLDEVVMIVRVLL